MPLLPPAYIVRREGNVLTCVCPSIHQSVCPQGGYPYPIMLCNISQNAMGQPGGTLPGTAGGVPWQGGTLVGGTLVGGILVGGVPCRGVPCRGATLLQGNTHNDYLRYGKRTIHEGYRKYNTSKAIYYA